jgi:hypothetical protein
MAGTSPAMTKSVVQLDRIMRKPPLAGQRRLVLER